MPRRLTPQIFEVSAVDKGAGHDCRISLRKREEPPMRIAIAELEVHHIVKHQHETLTPRTPVAIAKAAVSNLTSGGDLDQNTAALLEQRLATETFPTLPLGKALTAWWATPAGAELQSAICKRAHIAVVTANPLGNAYDDVVKAEQVEREEPANKGPKMDRGEACDDAHDDPDGELEKLAKRQWRHRDAGAGCDLAH